MKVIIIMPACDWPRGSGLPHFNLRNAIASVFAGGHEDTELWIGVDGEVPKIREVAESFQNPRITYEEFPKTRGSGNHQRHELMKRLPDGVLFGFRDDDDAWVPRSIQRLHDLSAKHGFSPIFGKSCRSAKRDIESEEFVLRAAGLGHKESKVGLGSCLLPSMPGMPLWPDNNDYFTDIPYAYDLFEWYEAHGRPLLICDVPTVRVRPWEPSWQKDHYEHLSPDRASVQGLYERGGRT